MKQFTLLFTSPCMKRSSDIFRWKRRYICRFTLIWFERIFSSVIWSMRSFFREKATNGAENYFLVQSSIVESNGSIVYTTHAIWNSTLKRSNSHTSYRHAEAERCFVVVRSIHSFYILHFHVLNELAAGIRPSLLQRNIKFNSKRRPSVTYNFTFSLMFSWMCVFSYNDVRNIFVLAISADASQSIPIVCFNRFVSTLIKSIRIQTSICDRVEDKMASLESKKIIQTLIGLESIGTDRQRPYLKILVPICVSILLLLCWLSMSISLGLFSKENGDFSKFSISICGVFGVSIVLAIYWHLLINHERIIALLDDMRGIANDNCKWTEE